MVTFKSSTSKKNWQPTVLISCPFFSGKRSRKASEEANWQPGDFMRGLVQAAGEATRDGAAKRGKLQGKGNIIDWTFGATSNTTEVRFCGVLSCSFITPLLTHILAGFSVCC